MKLSDMKPTTWIDDKSKYPAGMGVYIAGHRVFAAMHNFARDADGNFWVAFFVAFTEGEQVLNLKCDESNNMISGVMMLEGAELGYYEDGDFINVEADFL